MYPVLLQLGNFELRTYGIIVALSLLLGLWLSGREAIRKGIDAGLIQDLALYAVLGGIVGARIYYVVFHNPTYFLKNPWQILAVWHGGIGIIGGLIGGVVAALWYCRRKKLSFWRIADTLAPGIILAQAAGILACLSTGDSYGKPADIAWAITYTDPRSMAPLNIPLHPVEVYEMAAYLLAFLLVWQTRKKYETPGFAFLTYLAGYGAARVAVEFFRGNPAIFGWGLPAAQVFGMAMLVLAFAGFYVLGGTKGKRLPVLSEKSKNEKGNISPS